MANSGSWGLQGWISLRVVADGKQLFDLSIEDMFDMLSARILNLSVEDCGYVELCFTNAQISPQDDELITCRGQVTLST